MRSHQIAIAVGFGDADPAGVVFYPRAMAWAHAAIEELIRHSAVGWQAWFASPTRAWPVRRAEAEFLRPMKAGETFAATASVERLGTTSVTFRVDFREIAGGLAATVRTTHVGIDRATGRPVALGEDVRAALGA
jgi:YbgC/YbaW family acyl-CoA thioester hydrolase